MENAFVKFKSDFQQFVFSNNILVVASAYSVGLATYELIVHILNILAPIQEFVVSNILIYEKLYLGLSNYTFVYFIATVISALLMNILKWLGTIALTFVLVEYLLNNYIVGLKSTIKEQQEKDFIVSKISAKKDNDTPIEEKVAEIKINEKKDEIVGEKIVDTKHKGIIHEVLSAEVEPFQSADYYKL